MLAHRCRFVEYMPQAIHALALDAEGRRLAVARANADIEIWNIASGWVLDRKIPGGKNQSVESIAWTTDGRLFSAGHTGVIIEWDLVRLQEKNWIESFGGAIWCIKINHSNTTLAAGCEDGSVRLFSILPDELQYLRSLDGSKGRILSLSWSKNDKVLVTGSAQNVVRKWNMVTGHATHLMKVESFGKEPTLIWDISILTDGTIVSGDSLGHVRFWDGEMGTLLQTIVTHEADILSLVADDTAGNGDVIYAAGIDHKIVQLSAIVDATAKSSIKSMVLKKYVVTGSRRDQSHDIRSLAIHPGKNILVSGGVEPKFMVHPLNNFVKSAPKPISPFSQQPLIAFCGQNRLVCCQLESRIELWELGRAAPNQIFPSNSTGTTIQQLEKERKRLEIHISENHNIVCFAISPDGKWIVVSDIQKIRLFRIEHENGPWTVKAISGTNHLSSGHRLAFSPVGNRFVIATFNSSLEVIDIVQNAQGTVTELRKVATFNQHQTSNKSLLNNGKTDSSSGFASLICSLVVSSDGKWLVSGDVDNRLYCFNLESLMYHSTLPIFYAQHIAVAFHVSTPTLVITCANNRFYLYDVENSRYSDWTTEYEKSIPHKLTQNRLSGIAFNPENQSEMILYGLNYFCKIDLAKPIYFETPIQKDVNSNVTTNNNSSSKRQKAANKGQTKYQTTPNPDNFKFVRRYQPILFLDYINGQELVIIERPWLSVMNALPPKLYRHRFGT